MPGRCSCPGKGREKAADDSDSYRRLPGGRPTRMRGRDLAGDERQPRMRDLHHGRWRDGSKGSHRHGWRQQMDQGHAQRAVIQMQAAFMRTLGNGLHRVMLCPMNEGGIQEVRGLSSRFMRHAVIHPGHLHSVRMGETLTRFVSRQCARYRRRERGQPEDPQGKPDQPTMTKAATVHADDADDADGNSAGRAASGHLRYLNDTPPSHAPRLLPGHDGFRAPSFGRKPDATQSRVLAR